MRTPQALAVATRAPTPSIARFRGRLPGLALVALVAAVATIVARWTAFSPLVVAIVLGAVVANIATVPDAAAPGVGWAARDVLRVGIVLLGLRLSLGDLVGLGADGLIVVAVVVTMTFAGTQWMAARLGVGRDLGLLVATGYSICGASAIAAMDGVVDAEEEETAYAIALVTLCGTLSIAALPLVAEAIGMSGAAFGTWAGAAVHDVGQVVATASQGDAAALAAATVVKLTRVVLLAPLVALVAIDRRRRRRAAAGAPSDAPSDGAPATSRPPLVPLFVVGFLVAIGVRSSGLLSAEALDVASELEQVVLTVALAGLGLGVRLDRMRRLGGRPLVLGLLAWGLVAGTALIGTVLTT